VAGQEVHHLPADLQGRDVTVEIDPVQTLKIKHDMTIEHVPDLHHRTRRV